MKRFYIIALLILIVLPLKAIKEVPVDFKCNIYSINKEEHDVGRTFTLACEDGGWCVVKKSNHLNDKVGYSGLFNFEVPGERRAPLSVRREKLRYARALSDILLSDEFVR